MPNTQTLTKIKSLLTYASNVCETDLTADISIERLDKLLSATENAVILLRTICEEANVSREISEKSKPYSAVQYAGRLEVNEFGWLHITINSLLPHCRYKTPKHLTDTISRLMQEQLVKGGKLPYFEKAFLIIEEHCNIQNRKVYDQDNKGWKSIPNALKGNIVKDDDQFSLEILLLSELDDTPSCHIYVMPTEDVSAYFWNRNDRHNPYF